MTRYLLPCLTLCLLSGTLQAAEGLSTMEAADFEYLANRSPTVFDAYYRYRDLYQTRHPYFFGQVDLVSGPDFVIPTIHGERTAGVQGAYASIGTVAWMWRPDAGLHLGLDAFLAGLVVKGTDEEKLGLPEQWSYGSVLFHATLFDTAQGWSAMIGSQVLSRPITQAIDGRRVFSAAVDDPAEGQTETNTLVLAGTVPTPWFGLDLGFILSDKGVETVSAQGRMLSTDLLDSFGPHLASYPQLDSYHAGLHLDGLKLFRKHLSVSSEAALRYIPGDGVAFNHAWLKASTVFFRDVDHRNTDFRTWDAKTDTDFHLGITLQGSFANLPGDRTPWGGGFLVEFLSIYLWGMEAGISLGAGYNYFEDILQLPLPNVVTGRAVLSVGI